MYSTVYGRPPLIVGETEERHFLHERYDTCCVPRGRKDAELFRRLPRYRGTKKLQSARLSNSKLKSSRVAAGFKCQIYVQLTVVKQLNVGYTVWTFFFYHYNDSFKSSISCCCPLCDLVIVWWNSRFFLQRSSGRVEISRRHTLLPPDGPTGSPEWNGLVWRHTTCLSV